MTYDCTKCKYFGEQTCVPNGFSCTYEPILPTLDRQTIKSRKLEKENEQLKKQYCERTDCAGRIGNSEKVEQLEDRINKAIEYIKIYRSYANINGRDYLKGRDEIGSLELSQVDELLEILKGKSE